MYGPNDSGSEREEIFGPEGHQYVVRSSGSSSSGSLSRIAGFSGSNRSLSSSSPAEQKFFSDRHAENSLTRMESYLKAGLLTDVTLIAGKTSIPAHRIVLSAASEYFSAMFTSNMRESKESVVEMKNIDGDSLWAVVNYCYTGYIEIREENVERLLATSCILQLADVTLACCYFLKKQLNPSNCIGISVFADAHGCDDLCRAARDYIMENFQEIVNTHEFLTLPADEVAKIIESDDVNVPREETVFKALMGWLMHDQNRTVHLGRLLGLIRLPLMSSKFIVDFIDTTNFFKEDSTCRDLLMEAVKYQLLPERRLSLQSVRTRPRKSTVGTLYAVGGLDGTIGLAAIEKYDLRTNQWSLVGHMGCRHLQFGVAYLNGSVYIVGGRDGLKTLNTAASFDLETALWSCLPSMSTHRHGLGLAALNGPLYAVGGHDGWSYLNTVERYDPQTRQWSFVASMNCQRSTAGVAVLNSKLYAIGGRDGSACLRSVECYDPHTNKWRACAPLVKRRGGVGVGVANGCIYALGGHDAPISNPSAQRFCCVERYDPIADKWTMIACMSRGRDAIGVGLLGDRLFAVGGYDGSNYIKLVEVYDIHTNKWEEAAPLPSGRARLCVVVKNEELDEDTFPIYYVKGTKLQNMTGISN